MVRSFVARALPWISLAALVVGLSACAGTATGGDGDGDGDDCAEDTTVSAGLTPTFTWEGGNALGLAVAEYNEGAARQWVLGVAGADGFGSPVDYGTVPAGAIEAGGGAAGSGGGHRVLGDGDAGEQRRALPAVHALTGDGGRPA
jgi:hypothetical protein